MTVSDEPSPEDREPASRVVEGLAQRSPEDRSRLLGALSRTSGNRAVTALLRRAAEAPLQSEDHGHRPARRPHVAGRPVPDRTGP